MREHFHNIKFKENSHSEVNSDAENNEKKGRKKERKKDSIWLRLFYAENILHFSENKIIH